MALRDEFFAGIATLVEQGHQHLVGPLAVSPREHFEASTVRQFYAAIDGWEAWRLRLLARLRRALASPEDFASVIEERFSARRFLVRRIRLVRASSTVVPVDLGNRDVFLDATGHVEMRRLLDIGREEPTWNLVRQNVLDDLRAFEQNLLRVRRELVFVGEPRSVPLAEALARLQRLSYLDHASISATATTAERHLVAEEWKSCAAALRPAVEQVIKDAYLEAVRRQILVPTAGVLDLRSQTDALCRGAAPFLERSTAQFSYGVYALLSGVGSHPGQVNEVDGVHAWHGGIAALLLLGDRLPS